MPETQSQDVDLLQRLSSEICRLLWKAGSLIKWSAYLSESMDLESETKLLLSSFSSLQGIEKSIKRAINGISDNLNEKRERSEGRGEREREREGRE